MTKKLAKALGCSASYLFGYWLGELMGLSPLTFPVAWNVSFAVLAYALLWEDLNV